MHNVIVDIYTQSCYSVIKKHYRPTVDLKFEKTRPLIGNVEVRFIAFSLFRALFIVRFGIKGQQSQHPFVAHV